MVAKYEGKHVTFYIKYNGSSPTIFVDTGLQKSVISYSDVYSRNTTMIKIIAKKIEQGKIKDLNSLYMNCRGIVVLREAREWI